MIPTTWLNDRKELLTWIALGLCVFLISLVAMFPFGALQTRVISELHRTTGIDAHITDWSVALPLGVEWRHVTLSKSDWEPVQVPYLQAKIGILKALSGNIVLDVVARQDADSPTAGFVKATLSMPSFSLDAPISLNGQIQNVDLPQILDRFVSQGVLNGTFSHRINSGYRTDGALEGEGTWSAEATDVHIDQIPLGGGQTVSLTFAHVTAGVACQNVVCDVTELTGEGNDGSFTGEGTITVRQPLMNSQLALTLTIVPGPGSSSKARSLGLPPLPVGSPIKIKIVGPLAQARIAL
ncbi:MAG: type II secretion system protein GspN [Nitrospira sp.]|nr:type II secretion system protein GspN [Nitrospira sp.]